MKNILLVDDDLSILDGFEEILTEKGFTVGKASNEELAWECLQGKTYQIAIIDIVLEKSNGLELIKKIDKHYPQILTIALTGYPCADYAIGSFHKGAFEFLKKPCSQENLLRAIDRGLEKINTHSGLPNQKHYFPWDQLIQKNPCCVDTILDFAHLKIKKEVFCNIKRCEENFQCICSSSPKVCPGDSYIKEGICFVQNESRKNCCSKNQIPFGYSHVCCCPIRGELFKNKIM